MNYDELIEKLMRHYTADGFLADVKDAKEIFCKSAGSFDEEVADFENKMSQFSDWYLFTRPLRTPRRPPVEYVFDDRSFSVKEDERPYLENLKNHRHSLYEFLKLKGEDLHLKDLFNGEKLTIKNSSLKQGFNKGEYFEARLIPHGDTFVFSRGFCFHPPEVNKFILSELKKIRKMDPAQGSEAKSLFILRLFRMRYGHELYKHLPIQAVYSNESKLGI